MADEQAPVAKGQAEPRTAAQLNEASKVTSKALTDATEYWHEHAPVGRKALIDARTEDDADSDKLAAAAIFLWLVDPRQFKRRQSGVLVTRQAVRAAVDEVSDSAATECRQHGEALQSGSIELPDWQHRMEMTVRRALIATGAVGAGGSHQLDEGDRHDLQTAVHDQLSHLAGFAKELEAGLPLNDGFLARSAMYGNSATGTYERVLRRGDLAGGFRWERRLTHSHNTCDDCLSYEAKGWVEAGTLPGIGQQCQCLSNCRCTFERSRSLIRPGDRLMPITGMNSEKCQQRNRIAARRGFDATPVRLYADQPPESITLTASPAGQASELAEGRIVSAKGRLPRSPAAALEQINANLGEGAEPLTLEQIHLVYMEAANTNLVGDRFMFLGVSTLRNIAVEAGAGFAFMNSHRTGGLSEPSELPYGRTFAGRSETFEMPDGSRFTRTVVGVYMLRGQRPNGDSGPNTDELYAGIKAGTIFDVSMGLYGGERVCDVCGNGLEEYDPESGDLMCPHVPGTLRAMTEEQVEAQEAKGVPGGVATYTFEDCHATEVSAVFDGAVPGAGFRKALRLARAGKLPEQDLRAARRAYARLARDGDFVVAKPTTNPLKPKQSPKGGRPAPSLSPRGTKMPKVSAAELFRFWKAAGSPEEIDLTALREELGGDVELDLTVGMPAAKPKPETGSEPAPGSSSQTSPELAAVQLQVQSLQEQLEAERRQNAEDREAALRKSIDRDALAFVGEQIRLGRATPGQRTELTALYVQAAKDDHASPAKVPYMDANGQSKLGTRVEALTASYAKAPVTRLQREIANGLRTEDLTTLPNDTSSSAEESTEYKMAANWGKRRNGRAVAAAASSK